MNNKELSEYSEQLSDFLKTILEKFNVPKGSNYQQWVNDSTEGTFYNEINEISILLCILKGSLWRENEGYKDPEGHFAMINSRQGSNYLIRYSNIIIKLKETVEKKGREQLLNTLLFTNEAGKANSIKELYNSILQDAESNYFFEQRKFSFS